MGRSPKLPGIFAPLADVLGVAGLADALGSNPRTLNNWARNLSAMPAIEAARLRELCVARGVAPLLYTHPNLANGYIASTPDGWVMWTWGIGAYARRTRYRGHLEGLIPADAGVLILARMHGWPY
jgi:hypothetical protein